MSEVWDRNGRRTRAAHATYACRRLLALVQTKCGAAYVVKNTIETFFVPVSARIRERKVLQARTVKRFTSREPRASPGTVSNCLSLVFRRA